MLAHAAYPTKNDLQVLSELLSELCLFNLSNLLDIYEFTCSSPFISVYLKLSVEKNFSNCFINKNYLTRNLL